MFVTLLVSQELIFWLKIEAPENVLFIVLTLLVDQPLISELNDAHPEKVFIKLVFDKIVGKDVDVNSRLFKLKN
jgi:hypothetical protein